MIASDAATWWLVAGTTSLACLTGGLMVATFFAVKAANRTAVAAEHNINQGAEQIGLLRDELSAVQTQANVAMQTLETESRPMLVPAVEALLAPPEIKYFDVFGHRSDRIELPETAKWWLGGSPATAWVAVKIRNIGRGPAILGRERIDVYLQTKFGKKIHGWISTLVIAPEDHVWVAFPDPRTHEQDATGLAAMLSHAADGANLEGNRLSVGIRYSDISGQRWTTSHLQYLLQGEERLQQLGIDLKDDE